MKLNDFNNRVNLPRFCAKLGYTDYQYIKIPTFGWFAYNKDRTFVGHIFDVVNTTERDRLFATITKDKPEYLDFDMPYSEMAEAALRNNYLQTQLWTAAFSQAKKDLKNHSVIYKGHRTKLVDVLNENGYNAATTNGFGVITRTLQERFNMLPWPKVELRGQLLIPTFHTPFHISSLECCSWDDPSSRTTLFLADERGWYGNIHDKQIVGSLYDLWATKGCTWDHKLDYWTSGSIFSLSETLTIPDYIRVWTEAQSTVFDSSPLERIIEAGETDQLRHYVGQLSYGQLSELEEATGQKLSDCWKKARETQVQIGTKLFVRRDNCYFFYNKGNLEQITNFVMDVERLVRTKKGDFKRIGMLHMANKSAPFEMKEADFQNNQKFYRIMKEKLLEAGLGIPLVYPAHAKMLPLIIDTFNVGAPIEHEDDQPSA